MTVTSKDDVRPSDFVDWQQIVDLVNAAFIARTPGYIGERGDRRKKLKTLTTRIDGIESKGTPLPRSQLIAMEAKWLINYTHDWARADARLRDLAASIDKPQPAELSQDDEGSWGGCCTEFYRRLEPTVDTLQTVGLDTGTLKPLTFLSCLEDPRGIRSYLHDLQTTDILKTGRNNRDELGAVQSALSQLIFKDQLRALFSSASGLGVEISDDLEIAYLDYLRQVQHPRTGYWGPWYQFDGRLYMLQDVSFTYHIIKYRAGEVENWPKIIDTTFRIKDYVYPYGWRPSDAPGSPKYADHHNYDIASIFQYGWPHMTRDQKKLAHDAIQDMLDWCLTTSVSGQGFVHDDGDVVDAYYFGVRFLDLVGYWDEEKQFWTTSPLKLERQAEVADNLLLGLTALKNKSEEADTARSILKRARKLLLPDSSPAVAIGPAG
jgi:hypothetical protein